MNVKRFVLACLAVFLLYQVLSIAIHVGLLGDTYDSLEHVFRTEEDMGNKGWIMFLTSAVWTVLFCYIFTRGYEGKGVVEGLRYGLLMGLFIGVPYSYESWMVYPITLNLAHAWLVATLVMSVAAGGVVALIYRPAEA